ncbi:hypothetical protein M434DRAFT_201897 [Hypoxylon sp. CO27-5]|nr:hypothetical protein M434DRAFT_201897 [Hypoxylon sp. CO27-5]
MVRSFVPFSVALWQLCVGCHPSINYISPAQLIFHLSKNVPTTNNIFAFASVTSLHTVVSTSRSLLCMTIPQSITYPAHCPTRKETVLNT